MRQSKYRNNVSNSYSFATPENKYHILGQLEKNLQQIDDLKTKVQESIDRLKEYRTALISAAVTGQIDVREAGT